MEIFLVIFFFSSNNFSSWVSKVMFFTTLPIDLLIENSKNFLKISIIEVCLLKYYFESHLVYK